MCLTRKLQRYSFIHCLCWALRFCCLNLNWLSIDMMYFILPVSLSHFKFFSYFGQSSNHYNPIAFFRIVILLLWSVFFQIMISELFEQVNNQFEMVNEALLQCDWHLFSIELRRMYIMITMTAQEQTATEFQGYGNFPCSRQTVAKVTLSFCFYFTSE